MKERKFEVKAFFDLPAWRTDPDTRETELVEVGFAVVDESVGVIRNNVNPELEGLFMNLIAFTQEWVAFGSAIRVDSDQLRWALEDLGM